ncbi:MAG: hypothetical protein II244_06645 [Clostridia bacterium]|nr:hypothetical protein [Clostridia bacterium]
MAVIRTKEKTQVDFNNVMELAQDAIMSRLNVHNIGRIIEFDKNTQTCTVELMILKQFNERIIEPAPITEVPLIILGAGGGHITLPNPVNTICLLLFLDRNMDNFMETGEAYVPETSRMHDFTDCIALTTFKTAINPLSEYDEDAITIFNEGLIEEVKKISSIKVYPNLIKIQTADGAYLALSDKVTMNNSSQDLGALIQSLITAIEGLTVNTTTGAVMQTTIDILDALAEDFKELINTPEE